MASNWNQRKRLDGIIKDIEDCIQAMVEIENRGPHYIDVNVLKRTAQDLPILNVSAEIVCVENSISMLEQLKTILEKEHHRKFIATKLETSNQQKQLKVNQIIFVMVLIMK